MSLLPSRGPETSTAQEGELQVVGVDEEVAPIFDALASDTARDVLNAIYEEPGTPSKIADRLDMSIQKVSYHLENLEEVDLISIAGTRYSEKGQEMKVYEPPEDPMVLFVGTEERKRTLRSLVKRVVPTLGILAVASAAVQSAFGGGLNLGLGGSGDGEPVSEGAPLEDSQSGADPGTRAPEAEDAAGDSGGDDVAIQVEETDAGAPTEAAQDTSAATGTPAPQDTPAGTGAPTVQETPAATGTPAAQESTPVADATGTPTYEARATGTEAPADGLHASGGTNETATTPTEFVDEAGRAADGALDAAALEPGLAFFLGGLFVLAAVGAVWFVRAR